MDSLAVSLFFLHSAAFVLKWHMFSRTTSQQPRASWWKTMKLFFSFPNPQLYFKLNEGYRWKFCFPEESFLLTWKIMANYPTQTKQSHLIIAGQESSGTGKKTPFWTFKTLKTRQKQSAEQNKRTGDRTNRQ